MQKEWVKREPPLHNYLRLLKLPPDIQLAIRNGNLSMGHARALVYIDTIDKQLLFIKKYNKNLNVRQTEELVVTCIRPGKQCVKSSVKSDLQRFQKIEDNLASHFATK